MLETLSTDMPGGLREIVQEALAQRGEIDPETPPLSDDHAETLDNGAAPPSDGEGLKEILEYCAGLDHSDTDNGKRLLKHFGKDLLVVSQEKAKSALYAVWTGTHWDVANGGPKSLAIVQQLGDRIMQERHYIKPTQKEQDAIDAGKAASDAEAAGEDIDVTKRRLVANREKALDAFSKRVKRRLDHAVSSKNVARMNAALACAAPHVIRSPDDFNADRMRFAVHNATIRFERKMERRANPKFTNAAETPNVPAMVDVCTDAEVKVKRGHDREDLITHVVPVDYQPKARCPRWVRFLETMLPDADVRRMVQVSSGLGLVGITVQKLFFHYGDGANGKSVYMETLCRLLGEVAVTLPATSLIGESGSSGGASPDLARLLGRRLLRVKELPEGEDLKENLVKELTGGETITARDLFAGYMDFDPIFIVIMSGNGYPRITGNDDGIWRRMAVVHWPVKVPEAERREFDDMIGYFRPEYPGILNWLIEGVRIFLREGLVIPDAVRTATQEYRDDMDRTSAFVARCVVRDETAEPLQAKYLYSAYCRFTEDEGGKPINVTAFGRAMSKKFKKDTTQRLHYYLGLRLRDVPAPQSAPMPEPPPGRFDDDAPLPEVF
ncbi:DNA primase family protein [Rhizobium sp. SU303]|uniref:DNA primase family protein n=1 Tax=Rhizobium sp. SU303 TaxID=3138065 RepID=UPI001E2F812D|nr:phage/plasmid primase, P4 family [Rhizobium leguminosarum]UFW80008.1 phage/plasmid primase, P4 family [Rhizobium leguminosarum bv. viciae]